MTRLELDRPASAPAGAAVPVPFPDPLAIPPPLKDALPGRGAPPVESSAFSNGPAVAEFERALARACGAADAVGVASGLDALRLGLIAAGVGRGDEVILPASTFVATAEAVTQAGARPVLADISERDC